MSDESNIRRLLAQYCHRYDDGDTEGFGALFADDAEFHVFGKVHKGRDAIRDNIGTQKPGMPPGQHVTYNTVIDLAGDTAEAWTDFLYLKLADDGPKISTAGRYHDRLRRDGDTWKFQSRTIAFLGE